MLFLLSYNCFCVPSVWHISSYTIKGVGIRDGGINALKLTWNLLNDENVS